MSSQTQHNPSPLLSPLTGIAAGTQLGQSFSPFQGLSVPPINPDYRTTIRAIGTMFGAGIGAYVGAKMGPDLVQGMLGQMGVPPQLAGAIAQHSTPYTAAFGAAVGAHTVDSYINRIL